MDTRHGASPSTATAAVANKPLVFSKMESLVREMQDPESGIPIRSQKLFLTSIPSAFMGRLMTSSIGTFATVAKTLQGYDLIEWLLDKLEIEDSAEAIHLANLLCQYGYFFPVGETRSLMVKDDSSLYRFQTPYYWASQNHSADTTDYAIYLTKRLSRNKQKHGLEDYEAEAYNKLKKGLQHKWDFVLMQAEEQVRLAKDRKKGDKIVTDSQERAYWRVYRPPPGFTNCLENAPIPDRNNMANRVKKKTVDSVKLEIELIQKQIERTRMKVSAAAESLITVADTYFEYDYFMVAPQPSNPWITDDITFLVLNESLVEVPTEKRVRRWGINFNELVIDPTGINEFTNYLRREYCHENIRFWQAVQDLKYGPSAEVNEKVKSIYEEFLKPGAPCEINIDGKTMEGTQQMMKNPSRYTYDLAAEHVYVLLLKKDCYPRFLRSEHYKNLLTNAVQPLQKKRFFSFGGPGKKKATAMASSNSVSLQAQTPQPLKRLGSDEQTGGTLQGSASASQLTVEGHLGIGSALAVFQPRVDCDPPYRGDLAGGKLGGGLITAEIILASASAERSTTGQSSESSDVCPWEASINDNICPWEAADAPQPKPPPIQQPMGPRPQQTLQPSVSQKQQLAKPPRPDRSKSVDANPVGPQKAQSSPFAPTLGPIRGTSPSEGSPVRGEKAKSVDVCPWESTLPPTKKAPGALTSPKESVLTTLAPSGVSYLVTERRASEGVLRMALGVCPWEDVLKVSPMLAITAPPRIETVAEQIEEKEKSPVKISVLKAEKEEIENSEPVEKVPVSAISKVDLSVRSGHSIDQKSPSTPAELPSSPASSKFTYEGKIATESDISTSSPSHDTQSADIHPADSQPPLYRDSSRESATHLTSRNQSQADLAAVAMNLEETHSDEEKQRDQSTSSNVVAPWEDTQQQAASDVCPWEDEESCKVDTPYVKRYTTFGYL